MNLLRRSRFINSRVRLETSWTPLVGVMPRLGLQFAGCNSACGAFDRNLHRTTTRPRQRVHGAGKPPEGRDGLLRQNQNRLFVGIAPEPRPCRRSGRFPPRVFRRTTPDPRMTSFRFSTQESGTVHPDESCWRRRRMRQLLSHRMFRLLRFPSNLTGRTSASSLMRRSRSITRAPKDGTLPQPGPFSRLIRFHHSQRPAWRLRPMGCVSRFPWGQPKAPSQATMASYMALGIPVSVPLSG